MRYFGPKHSKHSMTLFCMTTLYWYRFTKNTKVFVQKENEDHLLDCDFSPAGGAVNFFPSEGWHHQEEIGKMGGLLSSSEAKNKSEKHFLHLTRRHGHECRVNVKYCKHEGTVKRHLTDLPWQKEKKHNLSPTLCANTSVHAAQDITIQLSDTVTEEIKQKLLGYLEHVEIMFVFFLSLDNTNTKFALQCNSYTWSQTSH